MKSYRFSTNLKLVLIASAILLAVLSLIYTNSLVEKLREREESIVQLYASALEEIRKAGIQEVNPFQETFVEMERLLESDDTWANLEPATKQEYVRAVRWARSMPTYSELSFVTDNILIVNRFKIPAIVWDESADVPQSWRNAIADTTLVNASPEDSARIIRELRELKSEMSSVNRPVPIEISFPGEDGSTRTLSQQIFFGESDLIKEIRRYPLVQLLFVTLFILIGYLGFSYVRKNEQSSLWVGMAKEAAHQLGTPISSLMGWSQVLRSDELPVDAKIQALDEIDRDVERLHRVANRFSDIGSMPKLSSEKINAVLDETIMYIRRRLPTTGENVALTTTFDGDPECAINIELFEWVVENLLKNAVDSLEGGKGAISLTTKILKDHVAIDVADTGKGIDRRNWKNVFRPGYSTKKRGWGLGLSLSNRIIHDYHGGNLSILQSKPGEGTTFRILLPIETQS